MTHLHAQAGFGSSEHQHFDLHLLTFGDHVSHIGYTAFFAQLGHVDQPLPAFPADGDGYTKQARIRV